MTELLDLSKLGLTPEQRKARRKWLGGSNALDINEGNWGKLWEIKTGRREEDDLTHILAVMMGVHSEPLNLAWYHKMTGRPVTRMGEQLVHPEYKYLGVTLDAETVTATGRRASLQAKHVSKLDDAVEVRYTPQCTHEATVLGVKHYVVSAIIGSNKWELYEGEVDEFYQEEYLAKCAEFWSYVERDVCPPEPEPLPVPPPRQLRVVDMSESNMWGEYSNTWLANRPAVKQSEHAAKQLKSLIEEDVGHAYGFGVQVKRSRDDRLYITEIK